MKKNFKYQFIFIFFFLVYLLSFCFFYYRYVPLIKSFQMILVPLLFIMFTITSINVRWGILFFVFVFPLINNLPYFFGIYGHIPHAPTALVLFLVFFLGWLLNRFLSYSKFNFNNPVFRPIILFSLIIFVSGIITFFRYANFFPFLSDNIHELIVNINGVRAGGALMSDIFNFMNYITGFLLFLILFNTIKSKEFIKKLLIVLSIATLISLLFSLIQKYYSISLGNTPFWINLGQINSTFKDPNSFGIYLSAFLPLALGITFSYHKHLKTFFLLLIFFTLFVFPLIGSRSSLLGMGISSFTFFLLILISNKANFKKKIIYVISFLLIIVLLFLSFCFFSRQSILNKRISWSLEVLANKESLNKLFTRKIDFWAGASKMIKDYPLTGVGMGAFIIELPNYLKLMGLPFRYADSAENYFFQVGSELGIIGLFLIFWLFFEIFKLMRKRLKEFSGHNKDRFILIGAISGIVSIFVNFFFHSYIGSFEVKYFFWLLIAIVLVYYLDKEKLKLPKVSIIFGYKFKLVAIILPLFFGVMHLWNSTQTLSIKNRTEEFGWNQNFGLYKLEKDNRGFFFQWTKKFAGISVENVGEVLVIPIMASHPDIKKYPVKVKLFLVNHYFRRKKLAKEIILKNNGWIDFEYSIPKLSEKKIFLVFETDRVWQPLKYLGAPDPRWLAIGLGKVWFKCSAELPKEKIKYIQKIPYSNWKGKFKDKLWTNGISRIKFKVDQKNITLLLNVRGQKAFNLGPYIVVRVDNQIIGKTVLTENDWTSLFFTPEIKKGEHILSVEFTNNFSNRKLGQDRNVFLGDLEIIYKN